MDPDKVVNDGIRWLRSSGIYNADASNPMTYGGVHSYYDTGGKRHSFIYTEITAYAISLFLILFRLYGDQGFLDMAVKSGDWVVNVAKYRGADPNAQGSFLMGYDVERGEPIPKAYSFDNGVCVRGLTSLYRETGNSRFLHVAEEASSWLLRVMQNTEGSFKPLYDLKEKRFTLNPKNWFEAPGPFHVKLSMGLLELGDITGREVYGDSVKRLYAWSLAHQKPEGRFKENMYSEGANVHSHCYASEGLLYLYWKLKNTDLLGPLTRGASWLLDVQEEDGSLSLRYTHRGDRTRATYAVAQAARIWFLLHKLLNKPEFYDAARRACNFVLKMQNQNQEDVRECGGFHEYLKDILGKLVRRKSSHINSWTTMFAVHALLMLETVKNRDFDSCVKELF